MNSKNNNRPTKPATPAVAAEPPQMVRAAVVSQPLLQQITDAIRDHVPHKYADPILTSIQTVQYGNFPLTPPKSDG